MKSWHVERLITGYMVLLYYLDIGQHMLAWYFVVTLVVHISRAKALVPPTPQFGWGGCPGRELLHMLILYFCDYIGCYYTCIYMYRRNYVHQTHRLYTQLYED